MSKRVDAAAIKITNAIEAAIADKGLSLDDLLEVYSRVEDHLDASADATRDDIRRRDGK